MLGNILCSRDTATGCSCPYIQQRDCETFPLPFHLRKALNPSPTISSDLSAFQTPLLSPKRDLLHNASPRRAVGLAEQLSPALPPHAAQPSRTSRGSVLQLGHPADAKPLQAMRTVCARLRSSPMSNVTLD